MTEQTGFFVSACFTALLVGMAVAFIFTFEGCFTSLDEITALKYSSWTARDCMTVISGNTKHNLLGYPRNIYVMVTPYNPEVVFALSRLRQIKESLTDEATRSMIDGLLKQGGGIYMDEDGSFWTPRGRYSGDNDSLMLLVSLYNHSWPCEPPKIMGIPILLPGDMPCETPDISTIDKNLYLLNDRGEILYPKVVWGRQNNILTTQEYLLIVFDFTTDRTFLKSKYLRLKVDGFENDNCEFAIK